MNLNKTRQDKLTRRAALLGGLSLAAFTTMPAFAISPAAAQSFVESAIADLEKLINSGQSGSTLTNSVVKFFRTYADVPTVARAVLGTPWRSMSDAQKKSYIAAFENYVSRRYASQFDVLEGGAARVTRVRDGGQSGALVDVEFNKAGARPVRLGLQVSDRSGRPKILDIKLEGVSMIGAEREQVRAILSRNGNDINKLISALNG